MTHWTDEDDDDSGDWDADEDGGDTLSEAEQPDAADTDRPADDAVPCPFCRRAVYEDADVCPGCGNFIGGGDDPSPRHPWWVTLGIVLCLIAMLVACGLRMW